MELKDKAIVVTGGAGAIGFATAEILVREGAKVLLVDVNAEGLERRGKELGVETFHADCADEAQVKAYVAAALEKFGRIDGFFNNAGVEGDLAPTQDYPVAEYDRIVNINLRGVFLGLKYVLAEMVRQGGGSVVNTASIGSERGLAGGGPYNAAKHGVVGLTRTAASELGPKGIRVNCVEPGVIETPLLNLVLEQMFEGGIEEGMRVLGRVATLDRVGKPAEVGEVVSFLLSDRASFVNGARWEVDGGALATIRH